MSSRGNAGAGLCALELGRLNGSAGGAYREGRPGSRRRPDWFQSRERAEAFTIRRRIDGQSEDGLSRFEQALALRSPPTCIMRPG